MNTTNTYIAMTRMALAERIADKQSLLNTVSAMPWHRDKASIVSRVVKEMYELTVQMQNMR